MKLLEQFTEKEWQNTVTNAARDLGWSLRYHTYDSRRSAAGFPDLVMVKGTRLIFAELKTMRGKTSDAQQRWLGGLYNTCAEVYVWRPCDYNSVIRTLSKEG